MCDPGGAVVDVVANIATGGLYGLGEAVDTAAKTGNPSAILNQGLDLGMASTGNQLAEDVAGPTAGSIVNAVGGGVGALGSAGVFADTAEAGAATSAGEEAAPAIARSAAAPTLASDVTGTTETAAGDVYGNLTEPLITPNQPIAAEGEGLPAGEAVSGAPKPTALPAPAPSTGVVPGGATTPGTTGQFTPLEGGPFQANPAGTPLQEGAPDLSGKDPFGIEDLKSSIKNDPKISPDGKNLVDKMDPAKLMLYLAGGQAAAGLATGALSALSMSDQIALQKHINEQQQAQIQYLNRNNQFAPLVQFAPRQNTGQNTGLLSQPTP
ncbi:MAG: hypothetical protein KGI71_05485 [Patescibacteria group bacterium]|nr:hypothetical protein [Patescibacteria group bacterium]